MCGTAVENEIALGYVITFPNVLIKSADTVTASVIFFRHVIFVWEECFVWIFFFFPPHLAFE